MSNFATPATAFTRDPDELEGTLLPVAHAVPFSETSAAASSVTTPGGGRSPAAVPLVTSATPVSYFAYDDDNAAAVTTSCTPQVQDAPAVPLEPNNEYNEQQQERDLRLQIALAQRTGHQDNEAQREDIAKANRRVHAINYFTTKQVEQANQRAKRLSQEENQKGWQGPRNELSHVTAAAARKNTETNPKPKGTFGKDYEVREYDVKEYDTNEYQISEYKSMYDS